MKYFDKLNPVLKVVIMYIVISLIGMYILQMKIFINPGEDVSFLESFFTSISSFATTGLSVVDVNEVYNYGGWLVLIIFFNIGGMGIMAMNTVLFLLLGRKIGIKNRMLAKIDQNNLTSEDVVTILLTIVKMFLIVEIIGALLIFFKIGYMDMNFIPRAINSLFMASSAISGSGFYNTVPYNHDYFVLFVLMILMIFSFIGYPVLVELKEFFKHKKSKNKRKYKFSPFTKIVVKVNIATVIIFALIFLGLEYNNTLSENNLFEKIYYAFYISISTKSVGLNVFTDITLFQPITLLFSTIFMVIGGSPSSACGGIRVTTIYVIYAYIKAEVKGYNKVRYKNYYIGNETIMKAFFVSFMFIAITFGGFLLIILTNPHIKLLAIWYDVVSAITTTGFSTGELGNLNSIGIFIMALLMLVGRLGVSNIIGSLKNKEKQVKSQRVNYIEKEIVI
ncbi:MAG: potassium transporter TrkG [Mycoplasmatales bacterium]